MESCQTVEQPSAVLSGDICQSDVKPLLRAPRPSEAFDSGKEQKLSVLKGPNGRVATVTLTRVSPMDIELPRTGQVSRTATTRTAVTKGSVESDKKVNGQFLEGLEARFTQRCEVGLCLDDKTSQQALQLFKECKPLLLANKDTIGTGTVDETERLWNACVLFSIKRLTNSSIGGESEEGAVIGFTLSQILRVTKLSVVEFFKELPQFLAKAGPTLTSLYGDGWEKLLQVKDVQANFVHLTVLYNYFKRVYGDFFESLEISNPTSSGPNGGVAPIHMRFGWMLYLNLRIHPNSHFVDLVTSITGLLAIVIMMILHMPPSLRKIAFDHPLFKEKAADGRINIIKSLSAVYFASEDDVLKMVEKAGNMIGKLIQKNSISGTGNYAEQLAGIDVEGLPYFEGLMDEQNLEGNLRVLEEHYEEAYHIRGELDERMFINGDESLVGSISSGTPSTSGSKRKYDSICSPVQGAGASTGPSSSSPPSPSSSPAKPSSTGNSRMPPPTPVSVTMTTAKWLRTVIAPLPSHPSPELGLFFRSCDHDISADVIHRTEVLLEGIFPSDGSGGWRDSRGTPLMDGTWAEHRRLEATKLYYRVLGSMCRGESQRLHCKNLTSLLANERFHRCMIACSAELVLATHKTLTMTFPAVLGPTGITAFDLSKVIESFVRHEETLPRELKRHLNFMEEQILESMAWERGSSMYSSLIVAKKCLAAEINRLGLLAEPMPSLDSLSHLSCLASGVNRLGIVPEATPSLDHLNQLSRLASENAQRPQECGAGESVGASVSPQKMVASLPAKLIPGSVVMNISDQVGSLVSPVKERPSAFSEFTSPVKSRLQAPLQSAFASPQRPNPSGGGETCAETVITVFFQKVLKLAAVRIKDLCERLHQPNQVLEQVYRVMQHVLHHETSLFFNRHIDQLILCSIYGVCKVSSINVTFRDTVTQYRKQPQCKPHVFRNVFIDLPPVRREGKVGNQETGDIIKFYNEIFVPATKSFLINLGSNAATSAPSGNRASDDRDGNDGQPPAPGSPKASFPALPDMSPKKVSASHNVYVSPLRATKMGTLMSPHTRSLYACVGESTHAYQSPSKDLTAINNRLNRRLGRLDFNEASLVSDSLVAGSLYTCSRSANHPSVRITADSVLGQSQSVSWTIAAPPPPSPIKRPRPDR